MFANKLFKGSVVLAVMLQATVALGQRGNREWPRRYYRPVSPLPPELGFSYDHASTALEGALRGQAQLNYATGAYRLAVGQALICREEARWLVLENRKRRAKHLQDFRDELEQRRQARIEKRRVANYATRPARFEVYRLTAMQLNRATNTIAWPPALLAPEYDVVRGRLDELFRKDARDEDSLAVRRTEVTLLIRTLSDALRRNRQGVGPREYLDSAKFLCGLKLEAEYPLDGVGSNETHTAASSQSAVQRQPSWEVN